MLFAMVPVCPCCHAALFLLRYEGVEVDHCLACQGFWLDAGEIETLASAAKGAPLASHFKSLLSGKGRVSARLCPRCDARLVEFGAELGRSAGAETLRLDRCPSGHGLWFDARELPRLLAALSEAPGGEALVRALPAIFGKSLAGS
ncbi:MAG: zf-TFIIB domain-containing protein [Verrucomicrobiae bacterium]|nr:zf-TFIIB domain-containing protein [Verrucomicrobiae bacterium]